VGRAASSGSVVVSIITLTLQKSVKREFLCCRNTGLPTKSLKWAIGTSVRSRRSWVSRFDPPGKQRAKSETPR